MEAIKRYYKQNYITKVKVISRLLEGDKAEAEDIVQEAFYRALKFYPSFDSEVGEFDKWFNSIMFNCYREYLRSSKHRPESLNEEISVDQVKEQLNLDNQRGRKVLHAGMSSVRNPLHRKILHLFFIFGYTSKEIEQLGEVSQSNVTTIVNRFKEGLIKGTLMK